MRFVRLREKILMWSDRTYRPPQSFTFFTPTIVTGLGYESVHAQLLTAPPWAVGFVVAISLSYSADHFNARGWHITFASIIGGVGWLTAGLLDPNRYVARYLCLCLAACGAFPCAPSLTNWVTCNTPSLLTIPLAIALNNSCAGIGQIIAQWIWKAGEKEAGYPTGNFVCAGCSFYVAAVAIGLRLWYGRMNKKGEIDARGDKRVWAHWRKSVSGPVFDFAKEDKTPGDCLLFPCSAPSWKRSSFWHGNRTFVTGGMVRFLMQENKLPEPCEALVLGSHRS